MKNLQASTVHLDDLKRKRQKATKSHAERIRRNRINKYLEELKVTVLGEGYENVKMEQAAILEFSVEYLKLLKCQLSPASPSGYEGLDSLRMSPPPSDYSPTENDENFRASNHAGKRKLKEEFDRDFAGSPDYPVVMDAKRRKLAKRLSFVRVKSEQEQGENQSSFANQGLLEIPLSQPTEAVYSYERTPFQDMSKTIENKTNKLWRPW